MDYHVLRLERVRAGRDRWLVSLLTSSSRRTRLFFFMHPQVLRTRLRQPIVNGVPKYTGLWQTLKVVVAEEGARGLYGGLTPHLMRVVPNAAAMYR